MFESIFLKRGAMLLLVGSFGVWSCSSDDGITKKEDLQTELVAAINELRTEGCKCANEWMPPANILVWNEKLQKAAEAHARDMYATGYFSHLSPDGSSPIMRAIDAGYEGEYVGENIARGYTLIKDVMEGWKNSESHCKALMDTLYNEMGASEIGGYWVLELGRSK